MRKIFVFPTWLIVMTSIYFLGEKHSLKHEKITLSDWSVKTTPLNDVITAWLWVSMIIKVILIIHLN